MTRKFLLLVCAAALLVFTARPASSASGPGDPSSPSDEATLKALAAVAGAGTMEAHTYQYLEELSDDIGARVTGSPEAGAAIAWGVEKMKAIGLENVHTESWKLFRGWTRISADAEIVAPLHRRVMVDSLGWVGSTPAGGVEAQIVAVNSYDLENELKDNASKWRGKVLLVAPKGTPPADRMAAFAKFGGFLKAAHEAGAVAVIGGQSDGLAGFDLFLDHLAFERRGNRDEAESCMGDDHGVPVRRRCACQEPRTLLLHEVGFIGHEDAGGWIELQEFP